MKKCAIISLIAAICVCLGACGAPSSPASAEVYTPNGEATVDIVADGETFTYTDRTIVPSDFTVIEEIEHRRINMPLAQKTELVDEYLRRGADYKTALGVCFPLLKDTVSAVAERLYEPPVDSRAEYKNGRFIATREKSGRRLDEDKLYVSLYYCIKYGVNKSVTADTVEIAPTVTKEMLEKKLVLRSEFTTDFSASTEDRAHNVTLALGKIDGVRLAAGDSLSFNAIVGARTAENGYRTAKVIVDGKYVDGVGGGACQASTAVYNAALRAGLYCSANAHTICPSYCAPGLDAMISSASDLVIRNDTGDDVYFSTVVSGGTATVKVIGAPREYDYVPESVIIKTVPFDETECVDTEYKYFDGSAVSGDRMVVSPGREGIVSETYIKLIRNGELVRRERIRQNSYSSAPRVTVIAP